MHSQALCAKCHKRAEIDQGYLFCANCDRWLCPKCNKPLPPRSTYCQCSPRARINVPSSPTQKVAGALQQDAYSRQRPQHISPQQSQPDTHTQYKCNNCHHLVSAPSGPCPRCGDKRQRLLVLSYPAGKGTQTEMTEPIPAPIFAEPWHKTQTAAPQASSQIKAAEPEDDRTTSVYSHGRTDIRDYADHRDFLQGEKWTEKLVQRIRDLPPYVKYLLLPISGLIAVVIIIIVVNPVILPTTGQYGNTTTSTRPPISDSAVVPSSVEGETLLSRYQLKPLPLHKLYLLPSRL
jgi:hypothetical protein